MALPVAVVGNGIKLINGGAIYAHPEAFACFHGESILGIHGKAERAVGNSKSGIYWDLNKLGIFHVKGVIANEGFGVRRYAASEGYPGNGDGGRAGYFVHGHYSLHGVHAVLEARVGKEVDRLAADWNEGRAAGFLGRTALHVQVEVQVGLAVGRGNAAENLHSLVETGNRAVIDSTSIVDGIDHPGNETSAGLVADIINPVLVHAAPHAVGRAKFAAVPRAADVGSRAVLVVHAGAQEAYGLAVARAIGLAAVLPVFAAVGALEGPYRPLQGTVSVLQAVSAVVFLDAAALLCTVLVIASNEEGIFGLPLRRVQAWDLVDAKNGRAGPLLLAVVSRGLQYPVGVYQAIERGIDIIKIVDQLSQAGYLAEVANVFRGQLPADRHDAILAKY